MSVYRVIDLVGTSEVSWDDAAKNAVRRRKRAYESFASAKSRSWTSKSRTESLFTASGSTCRSNIRGATERLGPQHPTFNETAEEISLEKWRTGCWILGRASCRGWRRRPLIASRKLAVGV